MKVLFKNCKECKKNFETNKESRVFCSRKCSSVNKRTKEIEKNCQFCKKVFNTKRNNAIFCSLECRYKFQETIDNPNRKKRTIICINCKCQKEIYNYQKTKFCSKICFGIYNKKNRIITDNKTHTNCEYCNIDYSFFPYRIDSRFCSINCKHKSGRDFLFCKTCGKSFSCQKHKKRIYCGQECANKGVDKRKSIFSLSIKNFLDVIGASYESEKLVRVEDHKFFLDFYFKNGTYIECYGDYWHCNPIKYDGEYFHKKILEYAQDIWVNDSVRINKINKMGYKSIILWEYDWSNDNDFFKKLKKILIENGIC